MYKCAKQSTKYKVIVLILLLGYIYENHKVPIWDLTWDEYNLLESTIRLERDFIWVLLNFVKTSTSIGNPATRQLVTHIANAVVN